MNTRHNHVSNLLMNYRATLVLKRHFFYILEELFINRHFRHLEPAEDKLTPFSSFGFMKSCIEDQASTDVH